MVLLAGYAYAHLSSRRLKPRAQAVAHLVLLGAALALLPIVPGDSWKPRGGANPALHILLLLSATLGLPYFLLASTSPLLQQWFTRTHPGRSPYRLYALSNAGSLLALASYPFYFETHFTRHAQALLWGWGLLAYAVGCAFCARQLWGLADAEVGGLNPAAPDFRRPWCLCGNLCRNLCRFAPILDKGSDKGSDKGRDKGRESPSKSGAAGVSPEALVPRPSSLVPLLWLLLPACASVLLLATTNKMCQDVAVIPFLWVVPLALYLLSFIICFENPRWYARFPFTLALIAGLGGIWWALAHGTEFSVVKQVGVYSGALFACCMVCHGELYRLRPPASGLTGYYLMIAAGGALGGVFVAVAAPVLFNGYYELQCGALLCGLLFLIACARDRAPAEVAVPARKFLPRLVRFLASPFGPDAWPWTACVLPLLAFFWLDKVIAHAASRSWDVPKGASIVMRVCLWAALALLTGSWLIRRKFRAFRYWHFLACLWLGVGWVGLAAALWTCGRGSRADVVYTSRDFYGVLTVFEHSKNNPDLHHFLLLHGRITHGLQFADPERAAWPTTYYGRESGIGLAIQALPPLGRRLGLVGLGTGTLTTYGRAGDCLRIYEINPGVQRLANSWFKYLGRCPAAVEILPGDARLSMEREPPQQYDLLALDAFSSDAIPVHLLTREAFQLYERHLKPNGVLAVHISNHYLNLEPVVANLARAFHYKAALIDYDETDPTWWLYSSTWMLLTRNERILKWPGIAEHAYPLEDKNKKPKVPLWTDNFASLFQILR